MLTKRQNVQKKLITQKYSYKFIYIYIKKKKKKRKKIRRKRTRRRDVRRIIPMHSRIRLWWLNYPQNSLRVVQPPPPRPQVLGWFDHPMVFFFFFFLK